MDLVALANTENQVQVFRINGELVFGVPRKGPDAQVTSLRWKPNGRLLAVGYSDGIVLLVNTHTGGVVHKLQVLTQGEIPIRYLGWGLSLCDPNATKTTIQKASNGITLESLIDHGFQGSMLNLPPDLPAELASLDVEAVLPRISVLPALSRDEDLFSSRTSLDSLFHATKKEDQEATDALLMGTDGGGLALNVYDTFSLTMLPTSSQERVLYNHANHPYSSTHALLWQSTEEGHKSILFQPIDVRPITDTGRYLSTIASKTTQLQNLLRYLDLAQRQIVTEFKSSQDLPKKFMRNIEESLQENDHCSFVDAAYHLAVTGHCYTTMKEWLTDELGDRGQKRWEKAAMSGYESVRQYTHQNLIPGLQRFNVLMSRLKGLSKFQESSVALGLDTKEIDQIFETLNCLEILSHCILVFTNRELQQFHSFSGWLKHEIEAQMIDPLSASADELLAKDVIPDYAKILEYIQGPMLSSQLYGLLDLQIEDKRPARDIAQEGSTLYEHYKADIKKILNDKIPEKKLPGLQMLLGHLKDQCTTIFSRISASQGRKVRLGDMVLLGENIERADVLVLPQTEAIAAQNIEVYVAQVHKAAQFQVSITKLSLDVVNGISSLEARSTAYIDLPKNSLVSDLKFADKHTLILILEEKSISRVLYIFYRPASATAHEMKGLTYNLATAPTSPMDEIGRSSSDFSTTMAVDAITKHSFPSQDQPWRPGRIAVNGRAGRRILCVVAKDGGRYALFDLDSEAGMESGEDGEGQEDGSR